ncbi:MAG: DUF1697 domain-containing protein [Gemmatimonadetes bacterium]|nr:DUF1697 domain-containing protein [Gemmatimonadota bacterium]
MPRHIAFLRGINVGGHRVKMDEVGHLFVGLGFSDVSTFIASGNVVFESPDKDCAGLEQTIEGHLETELGYEVATFIRSITELQAISAVEPFGTADPNHSLYVVFLHAPPDDEVRHALSDLRSTFDDFQVEGGEIYWLCRGRLTESPAFKGGFAKAMGATPTTMRKITTLQRMVAKYAAPPG